MAADIWAELGIPRTLDTGAIRRAYATRLKATRPDADPQGFAVLRGAYERALAAASARPGPAKGAVPTPVQAAPTPAPGPQPMLQHLGRGDAMAAAEWLAAARAAGTLSLATDMRLADRLGWALAQDRSLPAATVLAAADRLGWAQAGAGGPWAKALQSRLDAERWLATLRQDAASWKRWLGWARAVAARTLLGRGKVRLLPAMGRDPTLRRRYGEYLVHAATVGDQFDAARIGSVGQLLVGRRRPAARLTRKQRWWLTVVTALIMLGFAAWDEGDPDTAPSVQALYGLLVGVGVITLAASTVWRWSKWLWLRVRGR